MKSFFLLFCFFSSLAFCAQPEEPSGFHERGGLLSEKMMVVSANRQASEAGLEVLKQGGNALDAAIATQMVLNLVEPQSSGIGGGGFLLYYRAKDQKLFAFDGREVAPMGICLNEKVVPNIIGGQSVGVPGVLKMLECAHQEVGYLAWETLFERAIQLAEGGFPISHRLHTLIRNHPTLKNFPATETYFFDGGFPKAQGVTLKNLAFAKTLRAIAACGSAPFYQGEIGKAIVDAVTSTPVNPGCLLMDDLVSYYAVKRTPLLFFYKNYKVVGMPPPAGGVAVAQVLGLLENESLQPGYFGTLSFFHHFCQALRLSQADKAAYNADPAFFPVPTAALINKTYLKKRSDLIDNMYPIPSLSFGKWPAKTLNCFPNIASSASAPLPSTSHISIVDQEGNIVSFTSSIENAFGSNLFVKGFFLNNQLTDFSARSNWKGKRIANALKGGKRPQSSMAPTIVFDAATGAPRLVIGSAGGPFITSYVAEALLGILDYNLDVQKAVSHPHVTVSRDAITLEKGTFLSKYQEGLEELGNFVLIQPLTSGTHAIAFTKEGLIGASDPRREGVAAGE